MINTVSLSGDQGLLLHSQLLTKINCQINFAVPLHLPLTNAPHNVLKLELLS